MLNILVLNRKIWKRKSKTKGMKIMTKEKLNALMFCMCQRAVQEGKTEEFMKIWAELSNRKCTTKAELKSKIKSNNTEE